VGTLGDIATRVVEAGVASPAVFIVGDVVALRSRLGFPLSGRRFLVPVIEGGSGGLSRRIRRLGGIVDEVCVGRIVKIENAFGEADLDGVDRIVLTSRNGWLGLDDRMRAAAEARGIRVEEVREVRPIGRTLHLTQPDADRVAGVKSIDVYRNEVVPIAGAIDLGRYDAAFFTCASSARRVHAAAAGKTLEIAIGPKTAAELERVGAERIAVAAKPTLDSLVDRFVSASTIASCADGGQSGII
jgi:uroporphyrinogen-III synthase